MEPDQDQEQEILKIDRESHSLDEKVSQSEEAGMTEAVVAVAMAMPAVGASSTVVAVASSSPSSFSSQE